MATAVKKKPLIPREHGAYGQLGLPLVTALAVARPTLASACLVFAAVSAFIAHESFLLLLGRRGSRAKREQGSRALRHGFTWLALAISGGSAGLWLGGMPVVMAAAVPLTFALLVLPIIVRGREKTLTGETAISVTLSAASIPVAVASGLTFERAILIWCVWVTGFTASTSAVRWVISAHRNRRAWGALATSLIATLAAAVIAAQSHILIAAIPYLFLSWFLILRPPSTRHIKRVGWTLIAGGAVTAVTVLVLVRLLSST